MHRVITLVVALACGLTLGAPHAGAAGSAKWTEATPPDLYAAVTLYDSNRHRTLVITYSTLWAVTGDGVPEWTPIWKGAFPISSASYVYDPHLDRIWAFDMGYGTHVYFPGQIWSMDLGTQPLTWVQRAYVGTNPYKRAGYAHVYDPIRRRVIVFAGGTSSCLACETNTVSILDLSNVPTWSTANPNGVLPSRRAGVKKVYDPWRDRMLFYGGSLYEAGPEYYDETWALSLGHDMGWTFLTPTERVAYARTQALVTFDVAGRRMFVMGGTGPDGRYRDTWALDQSPSAPADSAIWRPVGAGPMGLHPPDRSGAIGWVDPTRSRLLRYGGTAPDRSRGSISDLWSLSLGDDPAWTPLISASHQPPLRFGHVGFWDGVRDRWVVSLGDPRGTWARPTGTQQPWQWITDSGPDRVHWSRSAADPAGSRVFVFGGSSNEYADQPGQESSQLWVFDLSVNQWALFSALPAPTPRADALVVMDSARRRLIVHGGRYTIANKVRPRTDTWAYQATVGTWSSLPAGNFGGRWNEAGIYDPVRDRVVVFGGRDTLASYADVHVLPMKSGGTWSALATVGTPPPSAHSGSLRAAYDAAGDRMLVLAQPTNSYIRVYALSLDGTPTWSEVTTEGGPPANREGYAFAADPTGSRLFVSGGYHPGFHESWELTFDVTTPVLASLVSSHAAPDRVRIVWQLGPESAHITAYRRERSGPWVPLRDVFPDAEHRIVLEDFDVVPGRSYEYRLGSSGADGDHYFGEVTIEVPRTPLLALSDVRPNPVTGPWSIAFSLGSREPARIELFDVTGRRVLSREVGSLGAGSHTVALTREERPATAGLYFIRLTQGSESRLVRVTLLR